MTRRAFHFVHELPRPTGQRLAFGIFGLLADKGGDPLEIYFVLVRHPRIGQLRKTVTASVEDHAHSLLRNILHRGVKRKTVPFSDSVYLLKYPGILVRAQRRDGTRFYR